MERPVGERITAVEVSLHEHIQSCIRKHEKGFRMQLVVLAAVLAVLAKIFGWAP